MSAESIVRSESIPARCGLSTATLHDGSTERRSSLDGHDANALSGMAGSIPLGGWRGDGHAS